MDNKFRSDLYQPQEPSWVKEGCFDIEMSENINTNEGRSWSLDKGPVNRLGLPLPPRGEVMSSLQGFHCLLVCGGMCSQVLS